MQIILINGAVATGKTTLSNRLAQQLGYEVCHMDEIKNDILTECGKPGTPLNWYPYYEWQVPRRIASAVKQAIDMHRSLIVEGVLSNRTKRQLQALLKQKPTSPEIVEIFCYAQNFTTYKRFVARTEHEKVANEKLDRSWYWIIYLEAVLMKLGLHFFGPLGLSDRLLKVDTTDLTTIDYHRIDEYIAQS